MVEYISGKIVELTPTNVIVDNQGIGHILEISLQTYDVLNGKTDAVVFVEKVMNQRDGIEVDYGFASKNERELFRKIIGVSGIGASSARMILSSMSAEELKNAIISEDLNRIKSIKGIGLKTAQRMILELKDKVFSSDEETQAVLFTGTNSAVADEASAALQMLGFSKPNISKAIQKILKENPAAKVEEIIKTALQML